MSYPGHVIVPLVTEMLVVLEVEMIGSGRVFVGSIRTVSEHSLEPWEAITFLQTVTSCLIAIKTMRPIRATQSVVFSFLTRREQIVMIEGMHYNVTFIISDTAVLSGSRFEYVVRGD